MARRKSENALNAWVSLIAMLPWWGGVGLAVISYFWFHHVATAPLEQIQNGQIGAVLG